MHPLLHRMILSRLSKEAKTAFNLSRFVLLLSGWNAATSACAVKIITSWKTVYGLLLACHQTFHTEGKQQSHAFSAGDHTFV